MPGHENRPDTIPDYIKRCNNRVDWMDTGGYSMNVGCGTVTWEGEWVICDECSEKMRNDD